MYQEAIRKQSEIIPYVELQLTMKRKDKTKHGKSIILEGLDSTLNHGLVGA